MRILHILDSIGQDLRYAVRSLKASPAFSLVAVLSLALGIGANTALFSIVNTLMIRSLPVPHPEQLVQLAMASTVPGASRTQAVFSYPIFDQLRNSAGVFDGVAAMLNPDRTPVLIDRPEEPAELHVVSGAYFALLRIAPAIGRVFSAAQDRAGETPVAVMSYDFWQRRFHGDPSVIGLKFTRRNIVYTVIGVASEGFSGVDIGAKADFWIPLLASTPRTLAFFGPAAHGLSTYRVIARIKPGLTREQALAGANVRFAQVLEAEDREVRALIPAGRQPESELRKFRQRALVMLPAGSGLSYLRAPYAKPLGILLAVVALVLLIACANIANLLLARATVRRREIAVRLAIGAGRGRIFRQLLTESLLLALLGAAAGLLFAGWAGRALIALVVGAAPFGLPFQIDLTVLAFVAGVSILCGCLFGVIPAWRATRLDPNPGLKNEADAIRGRRFLRIPAGQALAVFQVAMSLVLVMGAVLFVGAVRQLLHQNLGFQRESVVIARFMAPRNRHTRELIPVYDRLLERFRALPGVQEAGVADDAPFGGFTTSQPLHIEGRPPEQAGSADLLDVSPTYFDSTRTALLAGRGFTPRDDSSAPPVAILNQTAARRFFPGESPIGKRFGWDPKNNREREIVGVVADVKWSNLRDAAPPFVYLPFAQPRTEGGGGSAASIRVSGDPDALMSAVRREVENTHVFFGLQLDTEARLVESAMGQELLLAKLSSFFGLLGLLIAAIGIFGLMSYTVSRRRREFGLRIALGAEPSNLLYSVLTQTGWLVAAGLAVGIAAAMVAGAAVRDYLFQIAPSDPAVIALAAITLFLTALLAAAVPAWRASRTDAMTVLRQD